MKAKIISAFPGTGKSYFYNEYKDKIKVLDSDSSNFSWIEKGVRHPEFPSNYIEHIKDNINSAQVILVSSHKEVREALVNEGIEFYLVYPKKEHKEEFIKRYRERGNDSNFIDKLDENWDNWIDELKNQKGCTHITITPDKFISDVIKNSK